MSRFSKRSRERERWEADQFYASLMGRSELPARPERPVDRKPSQVRCIWHSHLTTGPAPRPNAAPSPVTYPEVDLPIESLSAEDRDESHFCEDDAPEYDFSIDHFIVHENDPTPGADDTEDNSVEMDAETEEQWRAAWESLVETNPTSSASPPFPVHCRDETTFRSMDLAVDGDVTIATPAAPLPNPTTPIEYSIGAGTRFRTIADLDTRFRRLLSPGPAANQAFSITNGRALLDMGHFRVDPGDATRFQVRLKAQVCHPTDASNPGRLPPGRTRFPIVIFVHGNHTSITYNVSDSGRPRTTTGGLTLIPGRATLRHEVASYQGYRYLQEQLAAAGVVSVSIDTNAANLLDSLIRFRADLVLQMLDHLRDLDGSSASEFHERLDFQKVALVGHSRGGDAVAMAADLNRRRSTTARVHLRAVVQIAPTDFTGRLTPQTERLKMSGGTTDSFMCIYGSHDGDVRGAFTPAEFSPGWSFAGTGFRHYDRANTHRAMVFVHGATHNRFNSIWVDPAAHEAGSTARILAEAQSDNAADSPSVDPANPPSSTFPLPAGSRDARVLSLSNHQTLAREYVNGWLLFWLKAQWSHGALFNGTQANSLSTPVALQWKFGRDLRRIDDFDDTNAARNMDSGSVIRPSFVNEKLIELSNLPQTPHNDQVLVADQATGASRVYRTDLNAAARDVSSFTHLTFRFSKHFPNVASPGAIAAESFPPRFQVGLFDGTTRRSVDQTAMATHNTQTVRPYHRMRGATNLTKVHLQTWRIPLSAFGGSGGVSLTNIHAVEITFDADANVPIHLDTLAFVKL
ncbi:MAG: hypothetical protein IPK82_40295 [Polyangiaceae bacterium]|nr:hypothetical protein [Polyangiaceae bacterium]